MNKEGKEMEVVDESSSSVLDGQNTLEETKQEAKQEATELP